MSQRKAINTKLGWAAATKLVALILVHALTGNCLLEAAVSASARGGSLEEQTTKKPTLQERILEVPHGMMIEVRLLNKQKLRGRLGEVTSEGFSLQTAQGTKIETQKVAFADVKSFKQIEGTTGSKIGKGLIYALAGIGALVVVLAIWAMTRED